MKAYKPALFLLTASVCFFVLTEVVVPREDPLVKGKEKPVIETEPRVLDFGELLSGEVRTRKITILNKGDSELALLGIEFTCGCTIPQIIMPSGDIVVPDKKREKLIGVLKPGESAELYIEYKGTSQAGEIKKKITILSNDPENRKYRLDVLAKVLRAFTYEPRWLDFGAVQKGDQASRSMVIRSVHAGRFEITGMTGLPPYLAYTAKKLKDTGEPSVELTFHLEGEAPVGQWNWRLKINVNCERVKELEIPAFLKVLPPVTFDTGTPNRDDLVDFNVLERGKGGMKTIEIINKFPETPYTISGMDFQTRYPEYIEARLITAEEGVRYKILVTVKPEIDCHYFKGIITLKSDHPDLRKKEISVKGWISNKE